jgi:hypothetical protein
MSDFPNRPPKIESPLEAFAKQAGRALLRSGVRALARGAGEAANSVAEDADKLLEAGDHALDILKERLKTIRRPR